MEEKFPTGLVVGSLLTPLVLLTAPISIPTILTINAIRSHRREHENHSASSRGPMVSTMYGSHSPFYTAQYNGIYQGHHSSFRHRF